MQFDMLSLMDGNYSTNLIFLLTVNEERLSDYLVNRLNRIKYRKSYGDLEFDIMEEVIDDMLINKAHKQSIFDFFDKVNMRTFDLLTNLIKEMNLFNEDAIQCGMHLNLKPETKTYNVYEMFDGVEHECYITEWVPGDDEFHFHRKTLDYLPKITDNRTRAEAEDDRMYALKEIGSTPEIDHRKDSNKDKWYNWEVELAMADCEVIRKGKTFEIYHLESKLKFRMKETGSKISLVF
jgi:hypothetical protein